MRHDRQTVLSVLQKAEAFLGEKGCQAPRLDAQLLLAKVLDCDRVQLYLDYERPLTEEETAEYRELIRKRAMREPVAYLIGEREFWSLEISVDNRVLIPRPDSETLIEEVIELYPAPGPECFADIGTGSGCLACALGSTFQAARGVACDRAQEALDVAVVNLARHDLSQRVLVRQGHLAQPVQANEVDLICANLPYIPSATIEQLSIDVRNYEPLHALDGGLDGLDLIRELLEQVPDRLRDGGWLVLEVGDGQAAAVVELCGAAGFGDVHCRCDLSKTERIVAGRKLSSSTT